jgi:iron(III) transport system ATP-binding protein
MNTLITLNSVSKQFVQRNVAAVQNVSLQVESGAIVVMLGPSGSGKTTLLRLIAGFEKPDTGEISIGDHVVASVQHWIPPEKRGIGMVFQDFALFPHLTVQENIAFGLHQLPAAVRTERVQQMLTLINLPSIAQAYPHQLSGGQQQRVAIARALAPQPKVLLLDEPFSNIDTDLRQQMREEVRQLLHSQRMTAILVTHDQREAIEMADYLAVLNQGRLEQWGTPQDIYCRPVNQFIAKFVGQAVFLNGEVQGNLVRTEVGQFTTHTDFGAGTHHVRVLVRPENVHLGHGKTFSSKGRIAQRRYWGGEYHYWVTLESGQIIKANYPVGQPLAFGSPIGVQVDLTEARVFAIEKTD